MFKPYKLKDHICRYCKIYSLDDAAVPKALFEAEAIKPDLAGFPYPLPSKKSDYCCYQYTPHRLQNRPSDPLNHTVFQNSYSFFQELVFLLRFYGNFTYQVVYFLFKPIKLIFAND